MLFCFAGDGARDTLLRAGAEPTALLSPGSTLYERLGQAGVACHVFGPATFTPSTYDGVFARGADIHPIASLSAGLGELAGTLHATPGPAYAYVYWDEVDTLGHEYGPSSAQFAAAAERCLDALDAGLRALPEGTVVLLAADHGQVDVDPATTVYVNEAWPQIVGPAGAGEGRAPARPGRLGARPLPALPARGDRRGDRRPRAPARRARGGPPRGRPRRRRLAGHASARACARGWPTSASCRRPARRSGGASATASTCASAAITAGCRRTRRRPRSPRWSCDAAVRPTASVAYVRPMRSVPDSPPLNGLTSGL